MHRALNALVSVLIVGSVGAGMPASAVPSANESKPIVNGEVTPRPDPISVKLRLVKDKSERNRVIAILRGSATAIPFGFPLTPQGPTATEYFCELSTQNVHARKSDNFEKIGPKPKTRCPRKVEAIVHRTTLKYLKGLQWRNANPSYIDSDANQSMHISLSISHPCKTFKFTKWTSKTVSYVVDRSYLYTGTIRSVPSGISCSV